MLAGLLAVLVLLTVRARFNDPDMWWQLKLGQIIWTTHTIPLTDLFSFTSRHQAVIPQEWLAQLTIFTAYHWGGLSGLMLWLAFFSIVLVLAGYILCWLSSGNVKVAFAGAMLIWLFATVSFSLRPQMIGYLLLVVELILIQLGRRHDPRWFLGLPVVFALWINCHGSFMLGLVLAGVLLFTSFFSFEIGSLRAQSWPARCRRMLAWAMLLSVGALFLNPVGYRQILYPFDTLLNMHLLMANVEEWAPLQMTGERGMALMAVLVGSFLLVATRHAEIFFDELLFLALGTWLAVGHMRMAMVFGILAAPILSRQLSDSWEGYDARQDRVWPNAVMLAASALVIFLAFPSRQNLESQVEQIGPARAVDFIRASHLSGPMLNDYAFGGYLIWAAPEHPVFIDGRTDLYEWSGVLGEFGNWAMLESDPQVLLDKYRINFCLLAPQTPMAHVLPLLPGWKRVYSDENAVIFAREAGR
jgi:hypothetical protein